MKGRTVEQQWNWIESDECNAMQWNGMEYNYPSKKAVSARQTVQNQKKLSVDSVVVNSFDF